MAAEDEQKRLKGEDAFQSRTPPSAAYLSWFLAQADVTNPKSPTHRLGTGKSDASPGNHKHDGRSGALLFNPTTDTISGDLSILAGQRQAIKDIINLLRRIGASDGTTN